MGLIFPVHVLLLARRKRVSDSAIMPRMRGYLSLILTGHAPYLRAAGREPEGEDALHETIALAVVPTLNLLFDLRALGARPLAALAYSPILLDQLADPIVLKHVTVWARRRLDADQANLARWEAQGRSHHAYLARFALDQAQSTLASVEGRFGRNLAGALRDLCADGTLEPLAGAATHAYLPLLGRDESLRAQLEIGAMAVARCLGRRPRGVWLPECGYAPFVESAARSAGARYLIVDPSSLPPGTTVTHLRPRWLAPRRLAAFVRDTQASEHVMSTSLGYPGDPLYRAARRDVESDSPLWRVGAGADELYDPYEAFQRAAEHARHFADVIAAELAAFAEHHDRPGIAVVVLDADTLGRRWFEGPVWLRALLELLAEHPSISLTTPGAYLRTYRPRQSVALRDGSWGPGGDHRAWLGREAEPLRTRVAWAEDRLAAVARRFPDAHGERERLLNQALRELLLAQTSDWSLGSSAPPDARPMVHLERCERLCTLAEADTLDQQALAYLELIEELDNPFPHLNYRVFR